MVNIASAVWANADRTGDKVAVRSQRGDLTYRQLRDRAARVNGAARDAELAPLSRVVLIAPSVYEFPILYYGLHAAGVTIVTMNTMSTPAEVSYVLEDCQASLVVAWHEYSTAATQAAHDAGVPCWIVTDGADIAGSGEIHTLHQHNEHDTAVLLYTSGTTGRPKGAELTVGNLMFAAHVLAEAVGFTDVSHMVTGLPLFHVYGQAEVLNVALLNGASISLVSPFNAAKLLETIERDRATHIAGVPTMWNSLLQEPETLRDLRALRFAFSGGAPLPVEVLRAFQDRFGCELLEGYGLTESTGLGASHVEGVVKKQGTAGPVVPGMELQIRNPRGEVLPTREVGEIHLRGQGVMKGYWRRPEATAEALVDGWLRTGDLGFVDEDGYLTVVDRLKELIIRGGYNVYPREVEEVLYAHPDIVEAAVVGVPDEHYGEEIAAAVVLRLGANLTASELRGWLKERLSSYKVPRLYQFLGELPKGSTGKVLKRALDPADIKANSQRPHGQSN